MVIREAQLADIYEITNILIEEMYTEVGIGEPSRSKVLDYITFLFNDGNRSFINNEIQTKRYTSWKNRNKVNIMKYIILGAAAAWALYMADKYLFF